MFDDAIGWLITLLPARVFFALLAVFVIVAGLLVYWAVYG
jgi:hypothetical protein